MDTKPITKPLPIGNITTPFTSLDIQIKPSNKEIPTPKATTQSSSITPRAKGECQAIDSEVNTQEGLNNLLQKLHQEKNCLVVNNNKQQPTPNEIR